MWIRSQRRRLACEKKVMGKELPQFYFYNPTGDTYVSGTVPLRSVGLFLILKCILGPSFPDAMPRLYVTSPMTLWKYRRRGTVNSEGVSHAFHTLSNGPDGIVQICHFKSEQWHSGRSLVGVFMKGLIWCRGYEAHLRTGKPISDFSS